MASHKVLGGLALSNRANRIAQLGEDHTTEQLQQILAITEQHVAKAKDFRWQSPGHIENQDRTLREYRRIATLFAKERGISVTFEKDMPAETNDAVIFPTDDSLQIEFVCL